ncbi:MAG TPA: hypothetical protein VF322_04565 [Gammaproteobacteria bacterium]
MSASPRHRRTSGFPAAIFAAAALLAAPAARAELYYLIVAGIGGEPQYDERFAADAEALAAAARRTAGAERVEMLVGAEATRDAVRQSFEELARKVRAQDQLAVFLIGHGSYDGERYKLNLKGPDLDGDEIAELLAGIPAGSQLVMNATSASGAVLESWKADGRTVITATRSGAERNATRFAEHWAAALSNDAADVNKNGSVSAQEAFDFAARAVADSFESEGTLATEHPQLVGDAAARFTVARLSERRATTPEGERLSAEIERLEGEIDALRARREQMDPAAYQEELERLLVQLALAQRELDAEQAQ